ncbi:MAG: nitroreductase [Hungatella sp.]|nr:nitroreductase [Hungatella sp.]
MTMKEAMRRRHTVRRYTDEPISANLIKELSGRIAQNNRTYGLNLTLVTGNCEGLGSMARVLLARGVNNYIILAGPDALDLDERLGYCGADMIIYAQTLGLNTWWVGGMFSKKGAQRNLSALSVKVNGVIVVGFGATQGVPHKSKTAAMISHYEGRAPQWFTDGVEALLYAPTALNKQPFMVRGKGNQVSISCGSGHFAGMDCGIGKYHFELGAGKEYFTWA